MAPSSSTSTRRPVLIPSEASAIVHWRFVDLEAAAPGSSARFRDDEVSEFYAEHGWLGANVSMSPDAELTFCKLLAYCGWLDEAWQKRGTGF